MSFLYRYALTVTRKQPYLDWAASVGDDSAAHAFELPPDPRTVYLVPETDPVPDLRRLLDDFWEHIFVEELSTWMLEGETWPASRTREMFDAWFDVELTESVYDLTPDEPLTQDELEAAERIEAVARCAWCGIEVEEDGGTFAGFDFAPRGSLALFAGRVLPLTIDRERVVFCLVAPEELDEMFAGDDVLVRACGVTCEQALRKVVPEALRSLSRQLTHSAPPGSIH